ncbi:hypothetical protein L1887_62106 [Cichorium endivia]|nr:hypothetical protein L1887_62106 [Cichorium endivia]
MGAAATREPVARGSAAEARQAVAVARRPSRRRDNRSKIFALTGRSTDEDKRQGFPDGRRWLHCQAAELQGALVAVTHADALALKGHARIKRYEFILARTSSEAVWAGQCAFVSQGSDASGSGPCASKAKQGRKEGRRLR